MFNNEHDRLPHLLIAQVLMLTIFTVFIVSPAGATSMLQRVQASLNVPCCIAPGMYGGTICSAAVSSVVVPDINLEKSTVDTHWSDDDDPEPFPIPAPGVGVSTLSNWRPHTKTLVVPKTLLPAGPVMSCGTDHHQNGTVRVSTWFLNGTAYTPVLKAW